MSEPLPDALCQKGDDGYILAANKKARAVLNKHFEKPRPSWGEIERIPGNVLNSPEYRALEFEQRAAVFAMLWMLYDAGLKSVFVCENCKRLHPVDAGNIEDIKYVARSGAEGVMPEHGSVQ